MIVVHMISHEIGIIETFFPGREGLSQSISYCFFAIGKHMLKYAFFSFLLSIVENVSPINFRASSSWGIKVTVLRSNLS